MGRIEDNIDCSALGSDCSRPRLLIVEPDKLTRWSIEEHLREVFDILTAGSETNAHALLDANPVDAVVIADDLPAFGADALEEHARARNPGVSAVRMITDMGKSEHPESQAAFLEKPFELANLARALGTLVD
ncbi:MAG: hypothetical protein JSU63_01500 [Phycisphaerales bacterium]|nr:MAG: hypothetical protein JSU63_01500 [Phycisphaerales bacterium]